MLTNILGNNPVTVLDIKKTHNKFHSRFDAKKRTYQYVIINRQSPLALQKNKAWHIRKKLDLNAMKKGAKLLLGTHDFFYISSFFLRCKITSQNFETKFQSKKIMRE